MSTESIIFRQKLTYEQFAKEMVQSPYLKQLVHNNRLIRHLIRISAQLIFFLGLIMTMISIFKLNWLIAMMLYPIYLYIQGLVIAGFMIHSHEMSHNHIKFKPLNNFIGVISGALCLMNFYGFKYAHKFHHHNIGNLDTPEVGAPVSKKGQEKIRYQDFLHRFGISIFNVSMPLWFFISWPLFVIVGDYCSWLLPFYKNGKIDIQSVFNSLFILGGNVLFCYLFPIGYLTLYLMPMLIGGNRILVITSMHHADEDTVFFNESEHNFYNNMMYSTDRDFGFMTNFLMMNNGFHIPHHLNPQIAYYDLKRASQYLQNELPPELKYHYFPKSRFYRDFMTSYYEKRLDDNYRYYQLKYI